MSQGSLKNIRFLGQKVWSVACERTDGQTHKWKLKQRTAFQGFRIIPSTYHQGLANFFSNNYDGNKDISIKDTDTLVLRGNFQILSQFLVDIWNWTGVYWYNHGMWLIMVICINTSPLL